jgi:hypothetical protein
MVSASSHCAKFLAACSNTYAFTLENAFGNTFTFTFKNAFGDTHAFALENAFSNVVLFVSAFKDLCQPAGHI